MFKKYYKAANDDIKTNRDLIDKIFEEAEKPSKTVKFANFYKAGTAIAAAIVLVLGAFMYPYIEKVNETPDVPVQTGQLTEKKKTEPIKAETGEQTPQTEAVGPIVKQQNVEKTAGEPAPEPVAEDTNSGINTAAATEDAQPFSIPERSYTRTKDAPPELDSKEILFDSFTDVSAEESERIQKFLITNFGETDEETGNAFIFEIVGKSEGMYLGRWKWFVVDHNSLLCEFIINEELTEMYECTFDENNTVMWNTSNNLLNN